MSAATNNNSDDEFHDALENAGMSNKSQQAEEAKTNEQIIEELLEQQKNMSLKDEEDKDEYKDAKSFEKPRSLEDNESDEAEYMDVTITEEELRELEKAMTIEELQINKEKANKMKVEGNEFFKNDKAEEAIDVYTQALRICPTTYPKERAVLYGNRAAAKIKLDLKQSALEDCSKAIELWPEYVRVLLRRAKLYEKLDKLDEALDDYKRVHELDPGAQEAHEACLRLPPIIQERNEKLKTECLDKLKDLGNMILKPFGLSTSNFQVQQDPNSGGYSINFNQNSH